MSNWQVGIAFIRGLNMFRFRRVKVEKVFKAIKHRETEYIRFIGAYKTDNIIFLKKQVPFGAVSLIIEEELSKFFKEKIYVTSRSLRTVTGVMRKAQLIDIRSRLT